MSKSAGRYQSCAPGCRPVDLVGSGKLSGPLTHAGVRSAIRRHLRTARIGAFTVFCPRKLFTNLIAGISPTATSHAILQGEEIAALAILVGKGTRLKSERISLAVEMVCSRIASLPVERQPELWRWYVDEGWGKIAKAIANP